MIRITSLALALLAIATALPAAAQDRGGLRARTNPYATLDQIEANRGCKLSSTSVTFGVNRAFATGSSASQALSTTGGSGNGGCRPLVTTQVAAGFNLALGRGSQGDQSVSATGQRGVLASTSFTRGVNISASGGSAAAQRIQNITTR